LIKIQKRQLYKIALLFFALFSYFLLSLFFILKTRLPIIFLFIFFAPVILTFIYLTLFYSRKKIALLLEIQKLQEDINLCKLNIDKESNSIKSIEHRIQDYRNLKIIIDKLNTYCELKPLVDTLLKALFELIADQKGNCLLYLADHATHKLNLFASYKEDSHCVIKAKEGDIFDFWVVRHTAPLLIEDLRKDFRFDYEILLKQEYFRPIGSLIICPLLSQDRFLGLIRIDHPQAAMYHYDDLRLLNTICDFSAVAIENTHLFEETKKLIIRDSLTSCYSKSYLLERLKEEFAHSAKLGLSLSFLMLDIDHFKKYNDQFGHIAGDIVLKELGQLLNSIAKEISGMVFRFGGEEFCILLSNTPKQKALGIAESIRQQVANQVIFLRQTKTSITVSIGVATYPPDAQYEDELIFKADYCLYQAKQKGRNQVCCI